MRRYCLSNDLQIESITVLTLRLLLSLQYQDLHNVDVIVFQYMYMSQKYCEIQMKIKAGPSGCEVISLQKVDSLLVFLNIQGAKKVCEVISERFGEKFI